MNTTQKILVTGGTGFVGSALVEALQAEFHTVHYTTRQTPSGKVGIFADLEAETDWLKLTQGYDVVVHTAALAHSAGHSIENIDKVNFSATQDILESCVTNKVKLFVFISSIKVHGEKTIGSLKFNGQSDYDPGDLYAQSKVKCEKCIRKKLHGTDCKYVILQCPLIIGDRPKGNVKTIQRLVKLGIPLPFGCLNDNKRSVLRLSDLCSLIIHLLMKQHKVDSTILAPSSGTMSTRDIVEHVARANGITNVRFMKIPKWTIQVLLLSIGRAKYIDKIISNLEVDDAVQLARIGWMPDNWKGM